MMFLAPKLYQHPEFKIGMRELAPQALGHCRLGLDDGRVYGEGRHGVVGIHCHDLAGICW